MLVRLLEAIEACWMTNRDTIQPLLDQRHQSHHMVDITRKRFRRCKSAPVGEIAPVEMDEIKNDQSGPRSKSILDKLDPSFRKVIIYLVTTVGYGDMVPNSATTKLLACVYLFSGTALVGIVLSKAADYLVEKQETLLIKAMHMGRRVGPSEILEEIETNKDMEISFSTKAGRIFAIFWILTSTLCLGRFFLYVAELNAEKRQKEIVKWVLSRRTTNVDLEEADVDNDNLFQHPNNSDIPLFVNCTGLLNLLSIKLKEMGKINQLDVAAILKEFESLDIDQSGTSSNADLTLGPI
ncbi:hypothetical protein RND71_037730 [Anisodus tanguticus]|uniref:Potassium channel domain-containing protein n=1 Tax=Anisodus tanguticus TaxID=243964 RepID=A0AAE1QZA7_9SOLA|nr:hypothetical protein RND71_037730 [Anisodus tanguticus]